MSFILAETQSMSVPRVIDRPLAAGASFLRGSAVLVDASGNIAECAANPAAIAGFSESGAGTDTNIFNNLRTRGFPPGRMQFVSCRNQVYRCKYLGTLPAADGGTYDIIKDSDGLWKVNFASSAAARVKLVGRLTNSPENVAEVKVRVIDANVQDF
jgi:hypothetical protein